MSCFDSRRSLIRLTGMMTRRGWKWLRGDEVKSKRRLARGLLAFVDESMGTIPNPSNAMNLKYSLTNVSKSRSA